MKPLTCLSLLALLCGAAPQSVRFYVIRQWKYVNFTWPDEDTLKTATAKGMYIPENNVIAGVKYFEDHFYITLPRMKGGVPATLTRIKAGPAHDASPNLEPFPSWAMNSVEDCNNLQNVQNVEIDARGQIWIIDGGRTETLMTPVVKCAPKLLIYDIKAERVTTVHNFPEEVASKNGSFLYDIVVDHTDGGYAYITDNSARDPGIIVYSVKENRSWKIRNAKTMMADPSATQFAVNGITISAPINIAGIALGPEIRTSNDRVVVNEDREVYFCPLSSQHLYSVNTTVLRDKNRARAAPDYDNSIKDIGLKPSQTVGMVMDNQGILYYGLLGNSAVGRWDSRTPFSSGQRLIARDLKYLEWPNSFTFDPTGNLTVLTNSLAKFIFGKMNLDEYNFRLITSYVGGKSYLYDDNFNYDLHGGHSSPRELTSPEPLPRPHPEPQPRPEPTSDGHHDHDTTSERTGDDSVKITQSSGCVLLTSLVTLILSIFVVLA
ncbi:hypothetical protein GEV33_013106 [Tenebrio molitor]|uniref:Uncharacterized protein n=1 Tax=Tenebrio molitor TaxID=7067 RepID=A0A8J6H8I6_TENMO|nr:hypothetical protein GEV33_013106 [Tenebrio molitor]